MRVFVTGGTGVIGRRAVPLLIEAGHDVTVAVRSTQRAAVTPPGATAILLDLFDFEAVSRAVNNLARAAKAGGIRRFVQESYGLTYADGGNEWLIESSPLDPPSQARSSVEAEETVMALESSGIAPVILRFALLYGADSVHTLDMIRYARNGRAAMFGDPSGYISSLHNDDAARAAVAALGAPAGIYNVTDDEPVTKRQYFDDLASALGLRRPTFFPSWAWKFAGPIGENLKRSYRISNRTFKEAAGWAPEFRNVDAGWRAGVKGIS